MKELKKLFSQIYDKSLYLLAGIVFLYVGFKLTNYYTDHLKKNKLIKFDPTAKSFIISTINFTIKAILIMITAAIIGIPTTTFFTVIGSCGLAIGLALQGGLSNVAGGIMLILFKPFKQNDYIEVNGKEGKVKSINIFYTSLITPDNKVIQVPNGVLSNSNITNYNYYNIRRIDLEISVSYNSNIEKVKKILTEILKNCKYINQEKEIIVRLSKHGDSALIFTVKGWVESTEYFNAKYDILEEVKEVFDKNKIEIPYPQLDIHKI